MESRLHAPAKARVGAKQRQRSKGRWIVLLAACSWALFLLIGYLIWLLLF